MIGLTSSQVLNRTSSGVLRRSGLLHVIAGDLRLQRLRAMDRRWRRVSLARLPRHERRLLMKYSACNDAVYWLYTCDFTTLAEAWECCHQIEWMYWLLNHLGFTIVTANDPHMLRTYYPTRQIELALKRLRRPFGL